MKAPLLEKNDPFLLMIGGCFLLLASWQPPQHGAGHGLPWAETALRATVKIECYSPGTGLMRKGAGVVIRPDGLIVTNCHNVDLAEDAEIVVNLYNGRFLSAELLRCDRRRDLALLRVAEDGLPIYSMGSTSSLRVGEPVFAIGHPHDLDFSLTSGVIGGFDRHLEILPFPSTDEGLIQTDVPTNTGCSGGPLLNNRGELIGLNTAVVGRFGRFEGYSFAIPVDMILAFAAEEAPGKALATGRRPTLPFLTAMRRNNPIIPIRKWEVENRNHQVTDSDKFTSF